MCNKTIEILRLMMLAEEFGSFDKGKYQNAHPLARMRNCGAIKSSSEWTRTTNLPDSGVIPFRIQILDRV